MARPQLSPEFQTLTSEIGVYALCDLDQIPVYFGQTVSVREGGIKARVRRHLTSARSDIIANQQLDVWELAFVRAWPVSDESLIDELEKRVYHEYRDTILAGKALPLPTDATLPLPPHTEHRILTPEEVARRKNPSVRLERQLKHLSHLLDVVLYRKDTADQRRALNAHLQRLQKRFGEFSQGSAPEPEEDAGEA